ncbi:MAG: flagellar hook-associated protein FlgK [Gammaproteobacteria bacterium]|nr:flagellar hook-associated protein FlgK [Gammaproteobacteria bacterium]
MASGDMLGPAVSGLLAFQTEMATIGNNIANVNTPGYSRERVQLTPSPPQYTGAGYIGTGVQVSSVQRIYDQYLAGQLNSATSANSQLQNYSQLATQVGNLLADPQAGLSPNLQSFFNAVQGVASDPSSTSARQVMLSQGQSLVSNFQYLDSQLTSLGSGVNTQITNSVNQINSLATSIAKLNGQITQLQGTAGGQQPNTLLDQRDELINQLSQQVAVTTVPQTDGSVNVFIGNGQSLVMGSTAIPLSVVPNTYDATRSEVGYTVGGVTTDISNQITGGTLGGALAFRDQVLNPSENALGQVAIGLAATFNAQSRLGMDQNGNINQNFFNTIDQSSPQVLPSSTNTGSPPATIGATVTDVSALTTSDYRLDRTATGYTLTRLSDNTVTNLTNFPGAPQTVDGVTLSLASGTIAVGDSFMIEPTRTAAANIGLAISSTSQIAAAAPISTAVATNASGVPTNQGTGAISAGSVSNTTNLPLSGAITLTYDASTQQFNVTGGPGGTLAYNPATDSGGKQFSFPTYGGATFTISGVPANGDSFVISNNANAVSDNRNALALAGLATQSTLANGTASYNGAYSDLIANVGTQTQNANTSSTAQQAVLNQVTQQVNSVSGVNLDQEAASLVQYQQAYQAAAQMISTSSSLFQTLIAAVGGH